MNTGAGEKSRCDFELTLRESQLKLHYFGHLLIVYAALRKFTKREFGACEH